MRRLLVVLMALLLPWAAPASAEAHLMVAQHGTLNFVDDGVFFVVSVPVTAFHGVDDNGDGQLSATELRAHEETLKAQFEAGFQLRDRTGPRPLQGLLLNLSPDHSRAAAPTTQVVAMGRFALASPDRAVRLRVALFGHGAAEKTIQIKATRGVATDLLVLTPAQAERTVFPSGWVVFGDYARLGIDHIATGFDHLLFLLVVLATSRGVRQVLLTLTCFTAGHATTLTASALGGVQFSPRWVESAIAATIVGLAAFDRRAHRRGRRNHLGWRLALVFGCALVHGLGFASSLAAFGLRGAHLLPSLAGFNLGVELGQGLVAVAAAAIFFLVRKRSGEVGVRLVRGAASALSITIGCVWFVERVTGW
jgi:HupE / UreJ protein